MATQGAYPIAGNWLWLFGRYNGVGNLVHTSADNVVVQSFTYTFPATSATGNNNAIIDGTLIKVGDVLRLDSPAFSGVAGYTSFVNGGFTAAKPKR
jgi:hypothetical protein